MKNQKRQALNNEVAAARSDLPRAEYHEAIASRKKLKDGIEPFLGSETIDFEIVASAGQPKIVLFFNDEQVFDNISHMIENRSWDGFEVEHRLGI